MKSTLIPAAILGSFVFLFTSCANVTFHDANNNPTGLKFYNAKQYLMVTYTGSKDNPVKADILSLADTENPTYAVYHPGWGSHNFTLSTNANGTISSYGQITDSKGPETITALGGLLSSAGAGFKAIQEGRNVGKESAEMDAVHAALRDATTALSSIALKPDADLTPYEAKKAIARDLRDKLTEIAGKIDKGDSDQEKALENLAGDVTGSKIDTPPNNSDKATVINDAFTKAASSLTTAATKLKAASGSPTPEKADFKIFEIRMQNGATTLIPVGPGEAQHIVRKVKAAGRK